MEIIKKIGEKHVSIVNKIDKNLNLPMTNQKKDVYILWR
jgi:hypothetical protein